MKEKDVYVIGLVLSVYSILLVFFTEIGLSIYEIDGFVNFIFSIVALIINIKNLKKLKRSNEKSKMVIVGNVLSVIALLLASKLFISNINYIIRLNMYM